MTDEQRYDVVVVGYGIAGAAAAIEAADRGARVLVLDRGRGGGTTALSGGVVYAGGGTTQQLAAGVTDSPENMADYLREETGGVVSEDTLRRFCEQSPAMIEWLEAQGASFAGTLCPYPTPYPTDQHHLFHSGNEQAWPYTERAAPAPRGHRVVGKGTTVGRDLFEVLRAAAEGKGVEFRPRCRVSELVVVDGTVTGVRYRTADPTVPAAGAATRRPPLARTFGRWLPGLDTRADDKADAALAESTDAIEVDVSAGAVVLAAGGFGMNAAWRAQYAAAYVDTVPVGSTGDDGSGIELGTTAGAATDHMGRMTAWRYLSPPAGLLAGVTVGPSGERIANEDLSGPTLAQIMIDKHEGRGHLIVDSAIWSTARRQLRDQTQPSQEAVAAYWFTIGHKKARTLDGLAERIGVPAPALAETVRAYNDGIASGVGDPARKAAGLCAPIGKGPFYAIDISIKNAPAYPAFGLTLGGLRVDEESGLVKRYDGSVIGGLYAAGRTAVGLCSNSYVGGLALADGVFSGRRAGGHAVGPTRQ